MKSWGRVLSFAPVAGTRVWAKPQIFLHSFYQTETDPGTQYSITTIPLGELGIASQELFPELFSFTVVIVKSGLHHNLMR